ncbi:MAG TPA: hypothetical protein VHM91_19170, partial [Verrucomicrobiales bacterium]|nr:hypothetical protein [Verrucomicrobiales bacterium]
MMTKLSFFCGAALALLPVPSVLAGSPAMPDKSPAPVSPSGGWRFSAGLMHRSLGGFDWVTGTQSVPSLLTIGPGSNTAGIDAIGPANAIANRTYTDGFVFHDAGTPTNGDTWNWGYNSAAQVSGNNIVFHGGNGTAATATEASNYESGAFSTDIDGTAPFVQLEWVKPLNGSVNIGLQGNFSFLNTGASRNLSTFTANKSRTDYAITYTDTYDLMGGTPPQAPYTGSLQGPGFVLSNIPLSRVASQLMSGSETASAFNSIHADFDLKLFSLSFGPVVEFHRGPLAVQASAGLTLNVADWDADQKETLFVSRDGGAATAQNTWHDQSSGTELKPGFFF